MYYGTMGMLSLNTTSAGAGKIVLGGQALAWGDPSRKGRPLSDHIWT